MKHTDHNLMIDFLPNTCNYNKSVRDEEDYGNSSDDEI